ncbi:hypothetical protein LWI29_023508 [Acer saccharum]|uniref:non-specific serine/threonine protein kinase n=1 Tax=Acer saccharum TaxID=4024 RepID=A0AA39STS2_ACESA|nr:hypothetical protein LWI29_023508 [Acer saccharum]
MNSHLFSSSPFLSLVCFLLVVFAKIQSSSSYPNYWYESCNIPFQCGNIKAGYPFWGESPQGLSRWEGCGHPELKLKCEHDLATTMMIKDVKYLVLYIKSEDRTLRIARMDYLEPEGICSPAFPNTTVNSELFDYSDRYENVTFLYDCPPSPAALPPQVFPPCINNSKGTVEHKNWSMKAGDHGPGMCNASVFFPVLKNSPDWKAIIDNHWLLRQVLDKGFELKWKLRGISCENCINFKGGCVSDPVSNETICFCTNACRPDINPNARTLRIARKDYHNGICSPEFPNTTINPEIFDYSVGYENMTFLYDCPKPTPGLVVHFNCPSSNNVKYKDWSILAGTNGPGPCNASVVVLFPRKLNWKTMDDPSDMGKFLKEGFVLKWKFGGLPYVDCTKREWS